MAVLKIFADSIIYVISGSGSIDWFFPLGIGLIYYFFTSLVICLLYTDYFVIKLFSVWILLSSFK